jgi:hypothetical protein
MVNHDYDTTWPTQRAASLKTVWLREMVEYIDHDNAPNRACHKGRFNPLATTSSDNKDLSN